MYDLYMFTRLYITFLKRLARQIEIRNLSSENLLVAIRAFIMLFDHLAKTDVLKESASEIFIMQIKSVIFAIRKLVKDQIAQRCLTTLQANMSPTQRNQLSQAI